MNNYKFYYSPYFNELFSWADVCFLLFLTCFQQTKPYVATAYLFFLQVSISSNLSQVNAGSLAHDVAGLFLVQEIIREYSQEKAHQFFSETRRQIQDSPTKRIFSKTFQLREFMREMKFIGIKKLTFCGIAVKETSVNETQKKVLYMIEEILNRRVNIDVQRRIENLATKPSEFESIVSEFETSQDASEDDGSKSKRSANGTNSLLVVDSSESDDLEMVGKHFEDEAPSNPKSNQGGTAQENSKKNRRRGSSNARKPIEKQLEEAFYKKRTINIQEANGYFAVMAAKSNGPLIIPPPTSGWWYFHRKESGQLKIMIPENSERTILKSLFPRVVPVKGFKKGVVRGGLVQATKEKEKKLKKSSKNDEKNFEEEEDISSNSEDQPNHHQSSGDLSEKNKGSPNVDKEKKEKGSIVVYKIY
jgi:hypothetical protein